jgi:nicotinate-nucleotide pyrophosphorylase (carboxylating)
MMNRDPRHYTSPVSTIVRADCETLIRLSIQEDAPAGDPTTEAIFPLDTLGKAVVIAREGGTLCGGILLDHLRQIFKEETGLSVSIRPKKGDGDSFEPEDILFELEGHLRGLLRIERVFLNFIQYLSGISTTVSRTVREAGSDIYILDTRKTLPGYRRLAKYAVFCGGGGNHRTDLSDMAMIKDNHIAAAGGIRPAIRKIRERFPGLMVEIEVEDLDGLREALGEKPDVILLDNMDVERIKEAIVIARTGSPTTRIEVSGGWTPEKLRLLSGSGPIYVSMGFLTHTTRFLDLSMEIVK